MHSSKYMPKFLYCIMNSVAVCQVGELSDELKELPKRALLASAFITYLAQAPEDIRRNFMNSWSENLGVQNFDCRRFLSSESEQLIWKSEGLPSDELSMENAWSFYR